MTERQYKRLLRQIADICHKLSFEGCTPNEVADGIKAIYTLAARCID